MSRARGDREETAAAHRERFGWAGAARIYDRQQVLRSFATLPVGRNPVATWGESATQHHVRLDASVRGTAQANLRPDGC